MGFTQCFFCIFTYLDLKNDEVVTFVKHLHVHALKYSLPKRECYSRKGGIFDVYTVVTPTAFSEVSFLIKKGASLKGTWV